MRYLFTSSRPVRLIAAQGTLLASLIVLPAWAVTSASSSALLINGQNFNAAACASERWPLDKPVSASNVCRFDGTRTVAYGVNGKFVTRTATGSIECSNAVFGDPIQGTWKKCYLNVATLGNAPSPAPAPKDEAAAKAAEALAKAAQAHKTAMLLWRNDLPAKHPKGSCASCHGADFFDLARTGSKESDIVRRAITDGATADEADALRQAVVNMRKDMKLPETNARTFRPFQPGGGILLPDLKESQWNIAAVKRDIAFAENVSSLLPTFYGQRIGTLSQAQKARDEMLDIARGSNQAGANPKTTQLRDLPVGLDYPLWSADKFHGNKEGTFNDWVSDLGFIPKPGRKVEWEALQNAYLTRPANDTFWAMYNGVDEMLELASTLGKCTSVNALSCGARVEGFEHKFKSALVGQHMMRLQSMGGQGLKEFVQGAVGFSYLDQQALFNFNQGTTTMLPNDMWNVGDHLARVALSPQDVKNLGDLGPVLGLPDFVIDSVDKTKNSATEEHDIRLPWFWIGFTFDPTFRRMHASNSTKSAEYMVGTLLERKLFNHNAFMTHMRMLSSVYLPEASVVRAKSGGVTRVKENNAHYLTYYSYFLAYGRHLMGAGYDGWAESLKHGGAGPVPQALKDRSAQLWSTHVSNGMRTTLLLLLEEVQNRPQELDKKWLASTAADIQKVGVQAWLKEYREHWAQFQPEHTSPDTALLNKVAAAIVLAAGF